MFLGFPRFANIMLELKINLFTLPSYYNKFTAIYYFTSTVCVFYTTYQKNKYDII